MKILVTGSDGFIGKNLVAELKNRGYNDIFEYNRTSDPLLLSKYCKEADFVFHLAGVNRSENQSDFKIINTDFTEQILNILKDNKNTCPVLFTSSTQATLDNSYGESKKAGENLLINYSKDTGSNVFIYRLPNVFGKWSKPNYNTVIATFCHNIANELPLNINDRNSNMRLIYIDDVVDMLIKDLESKESKQSKKDMFHEIFPVYLLTLGEIVDLLYSFKSNRKLNKVPNMSDAFTKKLYSTYLSFLPKNQFNYDLKMNNDERGSFTEFIKTVDRGQISINISKPGIVKGNHWHHTKNEKFLVVSGKGVIRLRRIDSNEVLNYFVDGKKLEVIDIPTGYTHNIENLDNIDMVTVMWANEVFNPDRPDTYFMEVKQ